MCVCVCVCVCVCGYVFAGLYTALLFPGVTFSIFFGLNLLIWGHKSSGAVPFGTLFALLCMWFGISTPLVRPPPPPPLPGYSSQGP